MDRSAAFTIGVAAWCRDGACGHLTQVVLDPLDGQVTHVIVEPEHREGLGRLVPVERVQPSDDRVDLGYTRAEFDQLDVAEEVRFLPGVEGMGYEPGDMLLWPYFGGNLTPPVVVDTLPSGEVAVRRGEEVRASDGRIGEVEGLVVDTQTHRVSHLLLKEGHLFGRKEVAIPIVAAKAVDEDGITLLISKSEVEALPAVDFRRPGS